MTCRGCGFLVGLWCNYITVLDQFSHSTHICNCVIILCCGVWRFCVFWFSYLCVAVVMAYMLVCVVGLENACVQMDGQVCVHVTERDMISLQMGLCWTEGIFVWQTCGGENPEMQILLGPIKVTFFRGLNFSKCVVWHLEIVSCPSRCPYLTVWLTDVFLRHNNCGQ